MKLDKDSVIWSMKAIDKTGDTDLFPRLVELSVLSGDISRTAGDIADIDISTHEPGPHRRFIVPKDDMSYRSATQLDPLDSIILTSIIHQYGERIEAKRRPASSDVVFSYRFGPSAEGSLYDTANSWNRFWDTCQERSQDADYMLIVDIADYYNQIYHHTIENQLNECGLPNQITKWVIRLLGSLTSKVSRGIPVGPHASHLLAEACLMPIDNSLAARGLPYCRYVDDMVFFAKTKNQARTYLYNLAEILDKQQRLQLQKSKTRIMPRDEFLDHAMHMIEDRPINEFEKQLVGVVSRHSGGNPYAAILLSSLTPEELRSFSREIVEKILSDYLGRPYPDFVRLRWFIRRLIQTRHPAAVDFLLSHFEELVPALSDICHYFASVADVPVDDMRAVGHKLLLLLDNEMIRSNEYFQLSIVSMFGRATGLNHIPRVLERYRLATPSVRREILIAAAVAREVDWIRELREEVPGMDPWAKRAYLFAAHQLPTEERKFLLRGLATNGLLESMLARWAKA